MEECTEAEVRAWSPDELANALATYAEIYGKEERGFGSLFHPELNRTAAGVSMCRCRDEVVRRLKLTPAV